VHHIELDTLQLGSGSHNNRDEGCCLLEAVAWWADEPHSDHPRCVCPQLAAFGRRLNDVLGDEQRQRLVPLIPQMVGTAGDGLAAKRRFMAADWSTRVAVPMWMDAAGRPEWAERFRALAPIVDPATLDAAWEVARPIRSEAWSARRVRMDEIRAKTREAVTKALAENKRAVADAAAVAAADAVADAVAVAVAVADAVADAAAAADAVADAVAAAAAVAVAAADADAVADAVADAAAAADAAADAVAAAAAVAVAAADADAVADAVADAAADTAADAAADPWSHTYQKVYNAVYAKARAEIDAKYAPVKKAVEDSAIELFTAMIRPEMEA